MKKVVLAFALVLLTAAVGFAAQPSAAQKAEDALALKGFDPVMLIKGKEVKGDEKLTLNRGGFKYLFSSTENKALFEKEPKKYEIQLGGTCAVVPTVDGDPELFVVYKERIYIFASPHCVEQFKAKPDDFVKN